MVTLTQQQLEAISTIEKSNFCLFTGPPGSGKTTTLASWLSRISSKSEVRCFAPTGRAARRMSEAFHEMGVSRSASTIHSGLQPTRGGYDGGAWQFRYNSHNHLKADLVVIDECSMIDNEIMVALLSAIKPGTHVVLVGDPDQLPPIGAGLPFLDMINSGVVPHAKLTEIHRFAGRLAHACQRINRGLPIQFSKAMSIRSDAGEFGPENIIHVKTVNDAQKHEKLEKIIKHLMSKGRNIHKDVQALVSRNEDGPVSRKAVSSRIQWLVNPDVSKMNECEFGLGDKVMCKSNGFREGYRQPVGSEEFEKVLDQVYVANGESGIVRHVNEDRVMIDFGGNILIKFSRDAWVNEKDLMLSYAITCHKSQGGGWPVIIYMIDSAKHVDRNLIYTAISRAKEMCFVIGDVDEMNTNIGKVLSDDRKTCVAEYLRELCT